MGPSCHKFPIVIAPIQPSDSLMSIGLGSGSPRPSAYLVAGVFFFAGGCVHPQNAGPLEIGARLPMGRIVTRKHQGLPGYWVILFVRAMAIYLADRTVTIALSRWRSCCLQAFRDLGLCRDYPFVGWLTMAHTFAYLRINDVVTDDAARLATGLPGSALTGRDSHPLDDYSEFQGAIASLLSQRTSIAWSHPKAGIQGFQRRLPHPGFPLSRE